MNEYINMLFDKYKLLQEGQLKPNVDLTQVKN